MKKFLSDNWRCGKRTSNKNLIQPGCKYLLEIESNLPDI